MIDTCKAYVSGILKGLGLTVQERTEDRGQYPLPPYAALTWGDEQMQRDGSRVGVVDDPLTGTRTYRRRLHQRTIPVLVEIAGRDGTHTSTLAEQFLQQLAKRIDDGDGNAIPIRVEAASTTEGSSLLNRAVRWQAVVEFHGGIYSDQPRKLINLTSGLVLESEITS